MKSKQRILVPEDDTHKQTITDVYNIYKTSYSKCYDSEEEMFFSDVVHHLELQSASTSSETDSVDKYKVESRSLADALGIIPTWRTKLPQNFGVNIAVSLSSLEQEGPEESPLNYIEDMGIEMIEYVKLRIGYNYLKSNMNKAVESVDETRKPICPGLTAGFEDPIILRMLQTQYIKGEDYISWILRSRRKQDKKKEEKSEESYTQFLAHVKSESLWKLGKEPINSGSHSGSGKEADIKNDHLLDYSHEEKARKANLAPLNAIEKQHIIMLTQYEVMKKDLPDDIDVFWPGKRDLEDDFTSFKTALSENALHQHFIQKFKSGKLERLDDDVKLESKEYFMETQDCMARRQQVRGPQTAEKKPTKTGKKKCSWQKLKEQFKDYTINQEITLSLFDNVIKEKTRLEGLNLCCIVKKLMEIHKEDPTEGENEGEMIWKDLVIVKAKPKEEQEDEEVVDEVVGEEDEEPQVSKEPQKSEEKDYDVEPEFRSMIYVTKVFPDPGYSYKEDKCAEGCLSGETVPYVGMTGGCTGYSMKDYKPPLVPQCSFKITNNCPDDNSLHSIYSQKLQKPDGTNILSSFSLKSEKMKSNDYVTFHTDWSNYPYTEMLDIIFHRHHKGYIYITDVFEIKPDTLREIQRIFHKAGKYSEVQCGKNAINSYICHDPQPRPPCNLPFSDRIDSSLEEFHFSISPAFSPLGEDKVTKKNKSQVMKEPQSNDYNMQSQQICEDAEPTPSNLEEGRFIKIQNIHFEKENEDYCPNDSNTSSDEVDNRSDTNYFFERFKSSQVSSVGFDSHNAEVEEPEYPVHMDFNDFPSSNAKQIDEDDDDYSDIVDFIKNFRFGDEHPNKPTNFEKPTERAETKEKGVFVDLLSSDSSPSNEENIKPEKTCDNLSVNSEDSLSLKDINGLLDKHKNCQVSPKPKMTINELTMWQAPRLSHKISGELYDVISQKRRSILQEIRVSFPLLYLYLNLKTNFSKINITGKLMKYRKYFQNIEQEYNTVVTRYRLNERDKLNHIKNQVPHRHLLYEEVYGKFRTFSMETFLMSFCDPFIRHLIIREAFQDIGTNLSFFLLQFIENDRFNLLYNLDEMEPMNHNKIIKEVGKFLQIFRRDLRYKRFLLDIVVIHYFETKEFFTMERLMQLDLNWEEIFQIPRKFDIEENIYVNVDYKDSVLQSCTGYSYLFYNLIKQFDDLFFENSFFKQFLDPELHPRRIKDICCTEIDNIMKNECAEFCEKTLISEIEMDIYILAKTIWKCEILGYNHCVLYVSQIMNRFPHETGNYLDFFFSKIITVKETVLASDIWRYNREFHYWYKKSEKTNSLLTKNNLFHFEKLLTICLLQSMLTFYEYRFHGQISIYNFLKKYSEEKSL